MSRWKEDQVEDGGQHILIESLQELGFSQYEARCYVGLMSREPQTGYRVSKRTGVPQPKVYETLRRLVARGVVQELAGDPTLFNAIPPQTLLDQLKSTFERRMDDAERSIQSLDQADTPRPLEFVERFDTREQTLAAAQGAISAARRRVYLSASAREIETLEPAMRAALAREVDLVVLTFGRRELDAPGAQVFRHASTQGALYRHHQARHLALVADSAVAINAVAADGEVWQGVRTQSAPIIAAVKGFIRHDIDMQQVFADFGDELIAAYGPGLQSLGAYRQEPRHDANVSVPDEEAKPASIA